MKEQTANLDQVFCVKCGQGNGNVEYNENRIFIPAKLDDNPYLDKPAYLRSLSVLDPVTWLQLRNGSWTVNPKGTKFERGWFKIVDDYPHDAKKLRWWDRAATEPANGKEPDWTAGVLVALKDGRYLVSANLISESLNANVVNPLQLARLGNVPKEGVVTPTDFGNYQDYWDSFLYVPKINRSIMLKHSMIWQVGYDIKASTPEEAKRVKVYLEENVDPWLIDGSLYALIFGNMYWHINKAKDAKAKDIELDPLDPATVGVKPKDKKQPRKGIESYVTFMGLEQLDTFLVAEVLHLKINAEPWGFFGYGSIRCVLPNTKAILYMEKKLPWLARRLAHPLLLIDITDAETGQICKEDFARIKTQLETRPDGADIYNDGSISKMEEVYKNVGQSRQMVEPLLDHFGKNETTGLGIPEIAHGTGSTTLKGTAAEQDKILESEIKWYQYWLKRFYEQKIFPFIEAAQDTHLNWRTLREEDNIALSGKICAEVDRGILSPAFASQMQGYPPEALDGAVRLQTLVPVDSSG